MTSEPLREEERECLISYLSLWATYNSEYVFRNPDHLSEEELEKQTDQLQKAWDIRRKLLDGAEEISIRDCHELFYMLGELPELIREDNEFDNMYYIYYVSKLFLRFERWSTSASVNAL